MTASGAARPPISVQLYTVRDALAADTPGTLRRIAGLGLRNVEPFKTVLSGDREAMANLTIRDLEKILFATLTGMTVDTFEAEAKKWSAAARPGTWRSNWPVSPSWGLSG